MYCVHDSYITSTHMYNIVYMCTTHTHHKCLYTSYMYSVHTTCTCTCVICVSPFQVFSGLFQSSTFGFAGVLPQKYIAAVMSGQVRCIVHNIDCTFTLRCTCTCTCIDCTFTLKFYMYMYMYMYMY